MASNYSFSEDMDYNVSNLYDVFGNYDTRLMDYPGNMKNVPHWEMAVKISVYSIIMITAVIGNILIILVVLRNRGMRTTTNFYIVNLAVSDLLVTGFCTWVRLVDNLTEGWVLGTFFCKVNTFAQGNYVLSACMYVCQYAYMSVCLSLNIAISMPSILNLGYTK